MDPWETLELELGRPLRGVMGEAGGGPLHPQLGPARGGAWPVHEAASLHGEWFLAGRTQLGAHGECPRPGGVGATAAPSAPAVGGPLTHGGQTGRAGLYNCDSAGARPSGPGGGRGAGVPPPPGLPGVGVGGLLGVMLPWAVLPGEGSETAPAERPPLQRTCSTSCCPC